MNDMLQSLDTIIAFVTVMMVCSLIVLILVQIAGSIFSLRGKNMANALSLTFQTIAPNLKDKAHQLADKILSDPLLSDSMWRTKDRAGVEIPLPEEKRGALSPLRLADALTNAPQTKARAPWSPFFGMTLANAIRPQEVYAALQRLAAQTPSDGTDPQDAQIRELHNAAKALLAAAGVPAGVAEDKVAALSKLAECLHINDDQKALLGAEIAKVKAEIAQTIGNAQNELNNWLLSAQDRAEQWFRTHTSNITVVVSIGFAFFCQLDAFEIFRQVSQKAPREALLKASEQLMDQTDGIFDEKDWLGQLLCDRWNMTFPDKKLEVDAPPTEAGQPAPAAIAHDSAGLKALRQKARALLGDSKVLQAALENGINKAAETLKTAKDDLEKKQSVSEKTRQEAEVIGLTKQKEFVNQLSGDFDNVFDAFERAASDDYLQNQSERLVELRNIAGAAGIELLPKDGWRWPVAGGWWDNVSAVVWSRHCLGILLFAGLLTLGAPFWFNLLKNLSSLRPALAQLIGEEQKRDIKPSTGVK